MQNQLRNRLQQLRTEHEKGTEQLATLEREARGLRDMLLRIGGAIQVLEEELAADTEIESSIEDPALEVSDNGLSPQH